IFYVLKRYRCHDANLLGRLALLLSRRWTRTTDASATPTQHHEYTTNQNLTTANKIIGRPVRGYRYTPPSTTSQEGHQRHHQSYSLAQKISILRSILQLGAPNAKGMVLFHGLLKEDAV
ncbi:unnamed protein product, partial [Amoebophrya sp. A25]